MNNLEQLVNELRERNFTIEMNFKIKGSSGVPYNFEVIVRKGDKLVGVEYLLDVKSENLLQVVIKHLDTKIPIIIFCTQSNIAEDFECILKGKIEIARTIDEALLKIERLLRN